jgi:hypothetical protein
MNPGAEHKIKPLRQQLAVNFFFGVVRPQASACIVFS